MTEPHETSAGETGGREARDVAADLDAVELLAVARAHHDGYVQGHSHSGAFACCSAHTSADDVPELIAEVERLRRVEVRLRATIADEHSALSQELEDEAEFLRAAIERNPYPTAEEYARAILRAEAAERALGEMRATDEENIGGDSHRLAKRELREIGLTVINPAKYGFGNWGADTIAKLYWALMRQRGEAIVARRELAEMRERIGEGGVEWRAEQPSGAWNMSHMAPTESIARQVVETTREMGYAIKLQRRVVGGWRDVEDGEQTAADGG